MLGLGEAVVEGVEFDDDEQLIVVSVRPRKATKRRCGQCGKRCPGYDQGEGRRRWRALDLGTIKTFLEADSPRVRCAVHGVVAAQVPWARHDAGHTYAFDDTAAWLVTHCSKSAVRDLLRIAWRTVGSIVTRVVADAENGTDRFKGLTRIGIDEISYKRGHTYLTVIVDHTSGVLLWAHPGRDSKTLEMFFDQLGAERCAQITLVSADAAPWIAGVVADRCKNAELCLDPFHIVQWATKALDEVRRDVWNAARKNGQRSVAKDLKNARFAIWKNPEDLTERQAATLAGIAKTNAPLYRAYLGATQAGLPAQGHPRHSAPGCLAQMGLAFSATFVREARQVYPRTPRGDRRRTDPRPFQRPGRERQHQTAAVDQDRVRVPLTRSTRRPRHARSRRHVPAAPRPRSRLKPPTDESQEPLLLTISAR